MIRDITIGQYYPNNSIIHKLDPRVKLFTVLIYIVSLFLVKNMYVYIPVAIALFTVIKVAGIPFKHMIKGMKPILFLLIITSLFNLFFIDGEVLFSIWFITVTYEGLRFAIFMALRLIFLIAGTSLMTFTTTPNQLTDGLEKALSFLKVFKVPVSEIAMMMSIALRFIPVLIEEVDKIMKAQMARGAVFDEGNIIKRVKAMLPILIPLFFSAFRRADDLAYAMESRCYVCGKKRTRIKPLKYDKVDIIAYVIVILYLLVFVCIKVFL